jgi:hypothetical protein
MGGKRFNGRGRRRFVQLFHNILDSPAWLSLTHSARTAYIHILKDFNGHNNGQLKLTYSQAGRLMNRQTFGRSIKLLIDRGFIEVTKHGGLNNRCAEYRYIEKWRNWKPSDEKQKPNKWQGRVLALAKG